MGKFITPLGEITIIVLGHSGLLIQWEGKNIFVDPYSKVADYSVQPPADLVILTHHHYDHLDENALKHIVTDKTIFVTSKLAGKKIKGANMLGQGEEYNYFGVNIRAVYAYNIEHKRDNGEPFHPRGEGNGYIMNFGGFQVYIAGDTEPIPEMRELGEIDLAFMPKNLPYTMSDDQFIEAVKLVKPKNIYPYHYFELDAKKIESRLPAGVKLHVK
jgi:L-ascorbate metabolism protein UlaG (beta-lactamase superfamily)